MFVELGGIGAIPCAVQVESKMPAENRDRQITTKTDRLLKRIFSHHYSMQARK